MENKLTEVEQARAILKQHGYYVDNLWSIQDVTDLYECTDEQAYDILENALHNECIMEQINVDISYACDYLDIKLKEDNED